MTNKPQRLRETDIQKLIDMAREEVPDKKVLAWIVERSPYWRRAGTAEIKKAAEERGIEISWQNY